MYDHVNNVTVSTQPGTKQESNCRDGSASSEGMYKFHMLPNQPLGFIQAKRNLPQWLQRYWAAYHDFTRLITTGGSDPRS